MSTLLKIKKFPYTDFKLFFFEKSQINANKLKKLSKRAAILKSNTLLENAVLSYDKSAREIFTRFDYLSFLGSGHGSGVLNCYRICILNGIRCVEKIYLNESKDLEALNLFKNVIDEDIKEYLSCYKIKTPTIIDSFETNKLTFVYTEYIENAIPLENCDVASFSLIICKAMELKKNIEKECLHQFYDLDTYVKAKNKCLAKFSNCGNFPELLDNIQEAISNKSRHSVCHGDIIKLNILYNGIEYYLIDWDRMGYYPWGFDIGYAVSKSLNWNKIEDYYNFVSESLYLSSELNTYNELSLLFFMFVFSHQKTRTNWPEDLKIKLMERILLLHNTLSDKN
jgi:tRNA A-37 threonylcarbamoyl transferase component Bud32